VLSGPVLVFPGKGKPFLFHFVSGERLHGGKTRGQLEVFLQPVLNGPHETLDSTLGICFFNSLQVMQGSLKPDILSFLSVASVVFLGLLDLGFGPTVL
jgi:hypothetical protein